MSLQEADTSVLEAKEDDPKSVARAVNYFYTLDYSDDDTLSHEDLAVFRSVSSSNSKPAAPESFQDRFNPVHQYRRSATAYSKLKIHLRAYVVADKYGIKGMMRLSKARAEQAIANCWPPNHLIVLLETIHESVAAVNMDLRTSVVLLLAKHQHELVANEEYLSALGEYGHLAVEVLQAVMDSPQQGNAVFTKFEPDDWVEPQPLPGWNNRW